MITKTLTIATLVLASITAQAACTTSDLKGTWYAQGTSGDSADIGMVGTDQCKFTVSSSGSISSSGSSCTYLDDDGYSSMTISGGKLSVSSACNVSGSFNICENGLCAVVKVSRSKMDRTKGIISMLGYVQADPHLTLAYTLVKQ